jgi:hypothetical protein
MGETQQTNTECQQMYKKPSNKRNRIPPPPPKKQYTRQMNILTKQIRKNQHNFKKHVEKKSVTNKSYLWEVLDIYTLIL